MVFSPKSNWPTLLWPILLKRKRRKQEMKKQIMGFAIFLLVCLVLMGGVSIAQTEKSLSFGAILRSIDIEFFQRLDKGIKEACALRGIDVDCQYYGNDANRAIAIAETYITQGKDGVIFGPMEETSAKVVIDKLYEAGIPVVLVDNAPHNGMMGRQVSSIVSESYRGGYLAGEALINLLDGQGRVARQTFAFKMDTIEQRDQGFLDAIADSQVEIVETIATDGTREDTLRKVPGIFAKHPDLKGFFCCQGDAATAVAASAKTAGLEDQLKVVAFDVTADVAQLIRSGRAVGVDQFPDEMGRRAVAYIVAHLAGKRVPYVMLTPVLEVNKENVELHQTDYKEFLHKYGGGFEVTDYNNEVTIY